MIEVESWDDFFTKIKMIMFARRYGEEIYFNIVHFRVQCEILEKILLFRLAPHDASIIISRRHNLDKLQFAYQYGDNKIVKEDIINFISGQIKMFWYGDEKYDRLHH